MIRRAFQRPVFRFVIFFLLLLVIRVPFYFTHHIQEDAYISLRCAENLAETGVYGFNPGERVSASTSHLYVFLAALVRLVFGKSAFIPAIQVLNGVLFLSGTWFAASAIKKEPAKALWLWVLLSSIPQALLASYSGMETSLLIFMIGGILYLITQEKSTWLVVLGLALLPWARPDVIAYVGLIIFWDCIRQKRILWYHVTAAAMGLISLLLFNEIYFGSLLHQSINAKLLMRHPFSLERFFGNLGTIFISYAGGMFSPIRAELFGRAGMVFLPMVLLGMTYFLWLCWNEKIARYIGLAVVSMSLLVPVAYAFGGVLYQWYFWPPAILGAALPLAVIVDWLNMKRRSSGLLRWGCVLGMTAGIFSQLAFSYVWGMKEFAYRGGMGTWLKERAKAGDTMLLEPAGYIPFYSGLYTYDEVGLVSPQVVTYREAYDPRWWPEFVMDFHPEWLVQREHITDFKTYQGYVLNEEEQDWFQEYYRLEGRFSFIPDDYTGSDALARLLSLSEADDYYIYRRVK